MNKYYGRKKYFLGKIKRINNTFSWCLVCGQDANRFSRMQLCVHCCVSKPSKCYVCLLNTKRNDGKSFLLNYYPDGKNKSQLLLFYPRRAVYRSKYTIHQ